jgi:DNA-binding XRE family transcriptional regulator
VPYFQANNVQNEKGCRVTETPDTPPPNDDDWVIPVPATGTPQYALVPWALYQRLIQQAKAYARDHALETGDIRMDYPDPNWMQAPTLGHDEPGLFDAEDAWGTADASDLNRFKGAMSEEQMPLEALEQLLEGDHPVKVFRKLRKLTQKALAELTGLNPTYLSQIETRKRGGSTRVYRRLAAALAVDIGDLID